MTKLGFAPTVCEFVNKVSSFNQVLAIGEFGKPIIRLVNAEAESDQETANAVTSIIIDTLHDSPVRLIKFNPVLDLVVSTDESGMIEVWDPETHSMPEEGDTRLGYELMSGTDLFDLASKETYALSMELTSDGKLLAILGRDQKLRVFSFRTGKLLRLFDETF